VGVGFIQMLGFVTQQSWLKGIGLITAASPLPIVFTQQKGVEIFAHDFYLEYESKEGENKSLKITPSLYKHFRAPYNYRNVLGAAISYGPILPEPIWQSVLYFAFQDPGTLTKALGLSPPLNHAAIYLKTRTKDRTDTWRLKIRSY